MDRTPMEQSPMTQRISVSLSDEQVAWLDKQTSQLYPRAQVIRDCIDSCRLYRRAVELETQELAVK